MQVTLSSGGIAALMEDEITSFNDDDCKNSLPPGFKFSPDDHELIFYLQIKVAGRDIIPNRFYDVDIYTHTPQQLHERYVRDGESITYYFSPRNKKYPKGKRPDRAVRIKPSENNPDGKVGFWKASSKLTSVYFRGMKIGTRRNLVFFKGKPKVNQEKTNWLMQEFMLHDAAAARSNTASSQETMQLDDWVLCKIYHTGSITLDQRTDSQLNTEQQDVQISNTQLLQPPPQQLQLQPMNQNAQFVAYPSPIPILSNINTENPEMPLPTSTGYLHHIGSIHSQFDDLMSTMPNLPSNEVAVADYNWEAQHPQNGFMQPPLMLPMQQDDSMLPLLNDYSMQGAPNFCTMHPISELSPSMQLQNQFPSDIPCFSTFYMSIQGYPKP